MVHVCMYNLWSLQCTVMQSNILLKIIQGPPNGLFHMWYIGSVLWRKPDKILKMVFGPFKGSQNKVFPVIFGIWNFHFYAFPNLQFLPNFQKIMFYYFYWCLASVISLVHSDFFYFWQCNKHYSEGTLIHNSLVYRQFKSQKSHFGGSPHIFIKCFVCKSSNKSIVESLCPIKSCTQ